jgi:hypothetical protein
MSVFSLRAFSYKTRLKKKKKLFRYYPLHKLRQAPRRREQRPSLKYAVRKRVFFNFLRYPRIRWKRKKRMKTFFRFRYLSSSRAKYRNIYKKLLVGRKLFMRFYKLNRHIFRRLNVFYCTTSKSTKFEKFLYFFEARVNALLVRIKFAKTQYHAIRYLEYGGVAVNRSTITYTLFVTNVQDVIELAYRFYRYSYFKKFIRYRRFVKKMRRRQRLIRYYQRVKREKFYAYKRIFRLRYSNRFYEKSKRAVAAIVVRIPSKIAQRKFMTHFTLRNMHLFSGIGPY